MYVEERIICDYTIHKMDVCLSQKYPNVLNILSNSVFHTGYNYGIHFEIEATFLE